MHDLIEEKLVYIESRIVAEDDKLFASGLSVEELIANLPEIARNLRVTSVFVLDDKQNIVPGGYVGRAKEGIEFRDWFVAAMRPNLPLGKLGNERGHVHV